MLLRLAWSHNLCMWAERLSDVVIFFVFWPCLLHLHERGEDWEIYFSWLCLLYERAERVLPRCFVLNCERIKFCWWFCWFFITTKWAIELSRVICRCHLHGRKILAKFVQAAKQYLQSKQKLGVVTYIADRANLRRAVELLHCVSCGSDVRLQGVRALDRVPGTFSAVLTLR
jgi:hypothetical protein